MRLATSQVLTKRLASSGLSEWNESRGPELLRSGLHQLRPVEKSMPRYIVYDISKLASYNMILYNICKYKQVFLEILAAGYDGKNVWALPRSLRALQTGYNFVEPVPGSQRVMLDGCEAKLRRWSTGPRVMKYKRRSVGTLDGVSVSSSKAC